MLTLHGNKAYHRIFDLEEKFYTMSVSNRARFYIYDSEFVDQVQQLGIDLGIAETSRNHVRENIPLAGQYLAAIDDIINYNAVSSEPAFIAQGSKKNDRNVLGEELSAPEIAAILHKSGQQDINSTKRTVITYPKDNADSKPRFLLFGRRHTKASSILYFLCMVKLVGALPIVMKIMNVAGDTCVTFPFYCRQRILSERAFQRNSRIAQEWIADSLSRSGENKLTFL